MLRNSSEKEKKEINLDYVVSDGECALQISLEKLIGRNCILVFLPGAILADEENSQQQMAKARGSLKQSGEYKKYYLAIKSEGYNIYFVTTKDLCHQQQVINQRNWPFPIISDPDLQLKSALHVATVQTYEHGQIVHYYQQQTLIFNDGKEVKRFIKNQPDADAKIVTEHIKLRNQNLARDNKRQHRFFESSNKNSNTAGKLTIKELENDLLQHNYNPFR